MKTLLKALCFLLLFQFTPTAELSAQTDFRKGYVLTNSKDTIKGFVLYSGAGLYSKCEFKTNLDAKATKYLPGEIESYRFDEGKFFITKRLSPKDSISYFLEYLIKGKLNVYYMRDNTDRYFVEKENGRMVELSEKEIIIKNDQKNDFLASKRYKGKLNVVLADCEVLQSEIQKTNLSHNSLISLAKTYHDKVCEGEKCIVFERKAKKVVLNFGIHGGLNINYISVPGIIDISLKQTMILGMRLSISKLVPWEERISLGFDINLVQVNSAHFVFNRSDIVEINGKFNYYEYKEETDLDLKATMLRLPFFIDYQLDFKKFKPYFGVGIINQMVLRQNENSKIVSLSKNDIESIPFYEIGLTAKIGTKFALKKNKNIYFELDIDKESNLNITPFLEYNVISYSFLLGYSF